MPPRDVVANARFLDPGTRREKKFGKTRADAALAALTAAGYVVLSGPEVSAIRNETLEEAAEVGKEAAKVGDCHHVAAAIRVLLASVKVGDSGHG